MGVFGGPQKGSGRPKGSVNKWDRDLRAWVKATGKTPLEFLVGVYRDSKKGMDDRVKAATAALPYCHARVATEINVKGLAAGELVVFEMPHNERDDLPAKET